jgi:arylsulfate sulfotransferase
MRQNTTYHMRAVVVYASGGTEYDTDHTYTTGTVPANEIPSVSVTTPAGQTPSPGVELSCLTGGSNDGQLELVAFDPQGNLVWYYNNPYGGTPNPVKLLPNGDLIVVWSSGTGGAPSPPGEVQEFDLGGNVIRQFTVSQLNQWIAAAGYSNTIVSVNHDIVALPNGHLLLIASEDRTYDNLTDYPNPTTVLGNDIVDLDPNNNVTWFWSAFDHLDVNRHGWSFPDWTHANALVYSPDDGNLLLSMRAQNWVIRIDYDNGQGSGNVLSTLGYQGNFTLGSSDLADWFYAQHDPSIFSPNSTGDITLGVFDNGNDRVLDSNGDVCGTAGQPACYSRSAIFDVNETDMTANLDWAYTVPYSFWGGVTQLLPNGDIYIDESSPADLNNTSARVLEVTQTSNPQVVWQMIINGQNSYRTIHLPSLYPGVQWPTTQ